MLEDIGDGARIFLQAEVTNAFDKNAYKVLVWKYEKLNHVGYVQRHSALTISKVMQGKAGYDNRNLFLVGRLKFVKGNTDLSSVEIIGAITDIKSLLNRDKALQNNGGIWETVQKKSTIAEHVEEHANAKKIKEREIKALNDMKAWKMQRDKEANKFSYYAASDYDRECDDFRHIEEDF